MKRLVEVVAAVLVLTWSLPSSAVEAWKAPARAAKKKNPVASGDASLAAGAKVWAAECVSCHGGKGLGDGVGVKDLEKKPEPLGPLLAAQSDGELFWKVTEGKKPMPGFAAKLSETDRWNVVNSMRALCGEKK